MKAYRFIATIGHDLMPKLMRVDRCLIHPGSDVCLVLGLPEGQQLLQKLLRSLYISSCTSQSSYITLGREQSSCSPDRLSMLVHRA